MGLSPESRARFNLERASVLLLEESPMGMSILVQILTGFGARTLHRCETVDEAKDAIAKVEVDLIICDTLGAGGELFTQLEDPAHQRPKAKVIQIVEIIEDLNARVAFIDQVTQLSFERFEFQFTGGNSWILPRRDCPLRLQPG